MAGSSLHSGAVWRRQQPTALGIEARRARREERQETSDRGRSAKASYPAASAMGKRRSLRTSAEQQQSDERGSLTSLHEAAELDRRVRVTATKSWPDFPRLAMGTEVDNQAAAPAET
jgi:hypothetical protein